MQKLPRSILVYCSSSQEVAPMFFSEAENLARHMAQNNIRLVYGGAKLGIMGHLADQILKRGGEVLGVIPEYLNKPGIVHESLTELIVLGNLLDRKKKMIEQAEMILAFPGGIGTLDEITESLAIKQLGEIDKPIGFLNFLDFWTPFLDYFDLLTQQKMIHTSFHELYNVYEDSDSMFKKLLEKNC